MTTQVYVIRPNAAKFPPTPPQCDPVVTITIKAQEAEKLASRRHFNQVRIADAIEANPFAAKKVAVHNITKRLRTETDTRHFTEQWVKILREKTPSQICALLRDSSEETEQLRLCHPFAGLLTAGSIVGSTSRVGSVENPPATLTRNARKGQHREFRRYTCISCDIGHPRQMATEFEILNHAKIKSAFNEALKKALLAKPEMVKALGIPAFTTDCKIHIAFEGKTFRSEGGDSTAAEIIFFLTGVISSHVVDAEGSATLRGLHVGWPDMLPDYAVGMPQFVDMKVWAKIIA